MKYNELWHDICFGTLFEYGNFGMKYLTMIRETTGTILTVKCPLQFEGRLEEKLIVWLQGWISHNHPEFFILQILSENELSPIYIGE